MYSFSCLEPVCCSMSSSNCFLTCIQVSQETGQVVWYSHLFQNFPQFIVIHTVKGFGIINKAEIDVFLELSCFFDDPADIGNLISGSSAFLKTSLNIWKFTVHVLLKPGLENFEHYFTSLWDECNCVVVWAFLALPVLGIGMKTDLFQSCGHCWVFQICWHIECSTFTESSFRIWNRSTGIPSPPLALFVVMLSKAHLTSHSRMSDSRWVITPSWLSDYMEIYHDYLEKLYTVIHRYILHTNTPHRHTHPIHHRHTHTTHIAYTHTPHMLIHTTHTPHTTLIYCHTQRHITQTHHTQRYCTHTPHTP